MMKFSKVFLLASSVCLVSPVLANEVDDDDDGDYAAAPIIYKSKASKQQKQVVKKVVTESVDEVAEVDDDDDGDYSAAPVVYKKKVSKQPKAQAKVKQKIKPQANKDQIAKLARAKWNSRSDIDPFE